MARYIRSNKDHSRHHGKVTGTSRPLLHKRKRSIIPKAFKRKRSESFQSSELERAFALLEEDEEDDVASSLFIDDLSQIESMPNSSVLPEVDVEEHLLHKTIPNSLLHENLPADCDLEPKTTLADMDLLQVEMLPAIQDGLLQKTLPTDNDMLPNTLQADTQVDLQIKTLDTQNELLPKTYELSAVFEKDFLLLPGKITEDVAKIKNGNFAASISTVGITTTEEKSEPQAMSFLKIQPGFIEKFPYTVMIKATFSSKEESAESPSPICTPNYPINYRKESYTFWIDLLTKDELLKMKGDKFALNYEIILSPK